MAKEIGLRIIGMNTSMYFDGQNTVAHELLLFDGEEEFSLPLLPQQVEAIMSMLGGRMDAGGTGEVVEDTAKEEDCTI